MPGPFRKVVSLADKDVSPGSENKEILSIELLPDGFSFSVMDAGASRYLAMQDIQLASVSNIKYLTADLLETGFKDLAEFSKPFIKVHVCCSSSPLVLLPPEVSDPEDQRSAFRWACNEPSGHLIYVNSMYGGGVLGVFSLPQEIKDLLDRFFPGHRLWHSGCVLMEGILSGTKPEESLPDIVLHIRRSSFEILIPERNRPVFYQLFHFQQSDDLLYYLFYVIEQLSLDAGAMNMLLAGEIGARQEIPEQLGLYFKNVSFAKRSESDRFGSEFDVLPHHCYFNLFNLNTCG